MNYLLDVCNYPSTHGVFEVIGKLSAHDNGGLVYMNGANIQFKLIDKSSKQLVPDTSHQLHTKTFAILYGGADPE
jgi:glycine cleavage system protein P-like pyridoxal-binding family